MRLFTRNRPDAATLAELAVHLGRSERSVSASVLAHAAGSGVVVVALRDLLAVRESSVSEDGAAVDQLTEPVASDTPDGLDAALTQRDGHAAGDAYEPTPQWHTYAWQEVQGGDWSGETSTLSFRLLDGSRHRVGLSDPGHVPAVFAERVQSSILVEERVRVPGGEVIVLGRRPPVAASGSAASPVLWHALAVGRIDLQAPGVADAVLRATERLRADYELEPTVW